MVRIALIGDHAYRRTGQSEVAGNDHFRHRAHTDHIAADPRIDRLREKMEVVEDPRYTREYLDPDKRSIGNAVQIFFKDGTSTAKVGIDYPLGHRRRRAEAVPLLVKKFQANVATRFPQEKADSITELFSDGRRLEAMAVPELMDMLATDEFV